MKRIGLLGGTFDPIHKGHLILAENAYRQLELDKVVLLVSPDPPHKKDKKVSDFKHRYNMALLASEGKDFLEVSDFETTLAQPSYTVNTLKALKELYPENRYYFIIGEDSLDAIERWYHPEEILQMTHLIVAVRDEEDDDKTIEEQSSYLQAKYNAKIHLLKSDYVNISSTAIRNAVYAKEAIDEYVPEKVEDYIWKENLYTKSEKN